MRTEPSKAHLLTNEVAIHKLLQKDHLGSGATGASAFTDRREHRQEAEWAEDGEAAGFPQVKGLFLISKGPPADDLSSRGGRQTQKGPHSLGLGGPKVVRSESVPLVARLVTVPGA